MLDVATAETVKALKERLAFHEERLADNPDFKAAQSLRRTISELAGASSGGATRLVRKPEAAKPSGKPPAGRVSQPAAAKAAILEKGHPLQTGVILDEMPEHGATIGGKNPKGNLVSILSGHPDFLSVQWRGGPAWWIKGHPLPSAKEAAE